MTADASLTAVVRLRAAEVVRGSVEVLVLVLVCLSPWVLGSVEPAAEFCLYCGVAVLLLLWAVRALLLGGLTWKHCPVSLGLAGLFLLGIFQLIPWPGALLSWLAPGTAQLTHELLPTRPELLPGGESVPAVPFPAGSTISLHPAETRLALVRLLAVLILFAVVRNNLGSVASLRRLSVAVLVNGFLLALFAVVQFFSSPPQTVYWHIPVLNNPFGPFICKNHFPFYLNLCIGLGAGLLFSLWHPDDDSAGHYERSTPFNLHGLLNNPAALWCACALAFMVGSVALSLSRGGLLSLTASVVVWLLLRFWQTRQVTRLETGLLIGAAALALVVWFGLEPITARLATIWRSDALEDARLNLWWDALAIVKRFPLWGTGYGSFFSVELAHRTRASSVAEGWEHAHNDYLEALVEGGFGRLLLSLAIIVLVYRLGWRAWQRWQGQAAQALIGGALFAFTTVVFHSFVDFGLHIPAIAVLVTVVAAQLSALGATEEAAAGESEATERAGNLLAGGLGSILGLGVALILGWVLCREGWRLAQTYGLEVAARAWEDKADPADRERHLALLEAAARASPDNAQVHLVLGQAYLDFYQAERDALEKREAAFEVARCVMAVVPTVGQSPYQAAQLAMPMRPLTASGAPPNIGGEPGKLERAYLIPALRHYLQARNLCPLNAKAQVQIAANVEWLTHADPRDDYLRRAKEACPCHPEIWYLAGILELADGHEQQAWASWRQSLDLSPEFLQAILDRARKQLDDNALIEQVLPARPDMQLTAAAYLHPEGDPEDRRPFLLHARALLENLLSPLDAATLHLRAQVEAELGDTAAALTAYETALRLAPQQADWRLEYATLLHKLGRQTDARHELRLVLGQQPNNLVAKRLLEEVTHEIATGN